MLIRLMHAGLDCTSGSAGHCRRLTLKPDEGLALFLHHSEANPTKFQQRYFVCDKHWRAGGSIFFYLGEPRLGVRDTVGLPACIRDVAPAKRSQCNVASRHL